MRALQRGVGLLAVQSVDGRLERLLLGLSGAARALSRVWQRRDLASKRRGGGLAGSAVAADLFEIDDGDDRAAGWPGPEQPAGSTTEAASEAEISNFFIRIEFLR